MERLILTSTQSPGDILMMTAAVRDLHLANPGKFQTAVRTPASDLWLHNPYVAPLALGRTIRMMYPLVHKSSQVPRHFVEGYHDFLSSVLKVSCPITAFHGDIHLSDEEKGWVSQVHEVVGFDVDFWIIVAGHKLDFSAKAWGLGSSRWQAVVDALQGRVLFVQTGEMSRGHVHPPLRGVIDLRGKTTTRQFVRLMYHAQGALCPVTFAMHLSSACPTKTGFPRPCVVIAGGREPTNWEAYPHHQFLHTNGALPCCRNGCWKSRIVPIGDGDVDKDHSLCIDLVESGISSTPLQRCMSLITPEDVVKAIELYFRGGVCKYLTKSQWEAVAPRLSVA